MECLCLIPNLIINSPTKSPLNPGPLSEIISSGVPNLQQMLSKTNLATSLAVIWLVGAASCPSCHVVDAHNDVFLPCSSPWEWPNCIYAPFLKRAKGSNWLLRAISEPSRTCALAHITCFTPKMCISMERWPCKTSLQDLPTSYIMSKMPTTNIIMA